MQGKGSQQSSAVSEGFKRPNIDTPSAGLQAALAASQRELNMVRAELQEAVQRQPLTLPLSTGGSPLLLLAAKGSLCGHCRQEWAWRSCT